MRQETRVKTLTGSLKASLRAAHEEGGRARARADGLRAHLEVAGARIRELTLELAARGVELDEATKRGDLGQREVDREERVQELEQELATERAALELLKVEVGRIRAILGGAAGDAKGPLPELVLALANERTRLDVEREADLAEATAVRAQRDEAQREKLRLRDALAEIRDSTPRPGNHEHREIARHALAQ